MALDDLIAQFEGFTNPVADATPDIDVVLSGVTDVYNKDISIRDSAVKDRETKIAELTKEKESLMLDNYKLLMKQPASNVGDDKGNRPGLDDQDEAERAATIKVSDLFTKREKN